MIVPNVEYKFLSKGAIGPYSGFQWPTPKVDGDGNWLAAGEWVVAQGELVMCANGVHWPTRDALPQWFSKELYTFEPSGKTLYGDDKNASRKGRLLYRIETWNEQTQHLLAAEYTERVLPIFEQWFPEDTRPRYCVNVVRQFAFGQVEEAVLRNAANAGNAAANAADAADAAAGANERQAQTDILMRALWDNEAWTQEQRAKIC